VGRVGTYTVLLDFCGNTEKLQEYLVVDETIQWYACADCAELIDTDNWELLIERNLAAYAQIRPIPDGEEPILREQVEHLVEAFRTFRLVTV
jgi:hypothetical protein